MIETVDIRLAERRMWAEMVMPKLGLLSTPEFEAALLPRPKEKLTFGGVRAGKSTKDALEVLIEVLSRNKPNVFWRYLHWFVLPSYETKVEEMRYLIAWSKALGLFHRMQAPTGGSWRLEMCGGRAVIETITAQNPEGLASVAPDSITLVEAGQMPESIRMHALGRLLENRGWLNITGTLEDEEKKPTVLWYGKLGAVWLEETAQGMNLEQHMAYSLPSWANKAKFPGGRTDPAILAIEADYPDAYFKRYVCGEPAGVSDAIYESLGTGDWGYHDDGGHWVLSRGVGGFDLGTTVGHPNALVAIQVDEFNVAVVRDAFFQELGDQTTAESWLGLASQKYGIPRRRWSLDPLQKALADRMGCSVARMGDGSRMRRTDMVNARIRRNQLKFDMVIRPGDSPAEVERKKRVTLVFEQMKSVHVIVKTAPGRGEYTEYARWDDDLAAAVEDAIELLDDKRTFNNEGKLPARKLVWSK